MFVKYCAELENDMQTLFKSLSEKDRRRYAAIEAKKLGYGGIIYIATLFDCDEKTVYKGFNELGCEESMSQPTIRQPGGGRNSTIENHENIDKVFLDILREHTAGDPMDEKVKWTNLTRGEIREQMRKKGILISVNIVKKLLKKHGYVKRKALKKKAIKQNVDRDKQFRKIEKLKALFRRNKNPIISIDAKKKESIGNLYREGYLETTETIEVYDHDYSYLEEAKASLYSIYDLENNEAFVNINTSSDTSDFACDSIKIWWNTIGKKRYPNATSILILADEPTGQLDSKNTQAVKELLHKIAQEFETTILVVTHDCRFIEGMDKTFEIIDGRLASITSQKDTKENKAQFPLKIKSYIDSTKHTRIPDVITESLDLESEIEFIIGETGTVSIIHPNHIPPKKIVLNKPKKIGKVLKVTPLNENYYSNENTAIQLQNVSKIFSTKKQQILALDDINLTFSKKECIFLVGPSGSGKSSLLNLIAGLESPTKGIITLLGKPVSTFSDLKKSRFRRKNIGMISQQGNLHPFLTVEENLFLKELYDGQTITLTSDRKSKSRNCLIKYNISHKHDFFPTEISGGELQRASIAVALYNKLPILLFDEPTANLDSSLALTLIREILQIPIHTNSTLIIATHDYSIINQGARVIELVDGKIKQDGLFNNK